MMKKMILIILLLSFTRILPAPGFAEVNIVREAPINYYDPLIKALTWVEVRSGERLYNEVENAVGWFQIRQIRVDDYNIRLGTKFVLTDFYDYDLSREMFLYYARGKTYEKASRDWNGTGPKTIEYWKLITARL
jgi:hypothetical protein